ncbi:ABC transporter substrate-binding protein [Ilumatobacter nonamiensis]|uniref:ABC transporter substrate-binding protein n=1 Tax=Ilumatobacter nonamiensis TaxID=467093 RepID=UPI000345B664|nr:extracellular solute-binding protein [Ilumatobacter nonamiensis]
MTGRFRSAPVVALVVGSAMSLAGCLNDSEIDEDDIVVFGPYRTVEADRFVESLEVFTDTTGIDVRYTGSSNFVSDLAERIENNGATPDVVVVPQPGLVQSMVDGGEVVPLDAAARDALRANYEPDIADAAIFDGQDSAVPYRRSLKSIVWFRPDVFEAEGWEVPRTLDELESLAEAIVASDRDIAPWCFSLQAGDQSGWAATDWVEDIVVRRSGVDVYEDWAAGRIGFADSRIEAAFTEFQELVLAPGRVAGRLTAVVATPVELAWEPLLATEPGCAMYKQADFALNWMPSLDVGPDGGIDWFALPDVDESEPPLLIGGDLIVALDDRPDVAELMEFLAGVAAGESWVEEGGFISAKSSIAVGAYPDPERQFIETLADAPAQVFDASDQMPPEIGSDLLWDEITGWVTGSSSYDDFAETMDTARDAHDAG